MLISEVSKTQIHLFVDVFVLGSSLGMKLNSIAVLRLIRKLRPSLPQIAVAEAQELFAVGRFVAAREILEEVDRVSTEQPLVKALLAATLFAQGDPLWESYVYEVRSLPEDANALGIAEAVEKASRRDSSDDSSGQDEGGEPSNPSSFQHIVGLPC